MSMVPESALFQGRRLTLRTRKAATIHHSPTVIAIDTLKVSKQAKRDERICHEQQAMVKSILKVNAADSICN